MAGRCHHDNHGVVSQLLSLLHGNIGRNRHPQPILNNVWVTGSSGIYRNMSPTSATGMWEMCGELLDHGNIELTTAVEAVGMALLILAVALSAGSVVMWVVGVAVEALPVVVVIWGLLWL